MASSTTTRRGARAAAAPTRAAARSVRASIERVGWQPAGDYPLDIEVMRFSRLRARIAPQHLRSVQRIAFHMLVSVTRGSCTHTLDFAHVACARGSLLVLRPGQVHRFDASTAWDGWLVIFRSELLLPVVDTARQAENLALRGALETLPSHLSLSTDEHAAVEETIARMAADVALEASVAERNALLRHQLYALLLRAHVVHTREGARAGNSRSAADVARFERFRALAERELVQRRSITEHARHLGCSEKTLARACLTATGMAPKAWLQQRLALEAKRLLAHTALPVTAIADQLGFAESTQFVKFFRRETGSAPGAFRRVTAGG